MIKKFFQALNSLKISYLLISGQATVLYGAATFSEDIDIWVKPNFKDWNNLLKVIRKLKGRIYKLSPPLKMDLIQRGHGYHFYFPSCAKELSWFLDVMGKVPRVDDFTTAFKKANYLRTDWGRIPVISIRDLVEVKKTRRLSDYAVISNLVRIEYNNLASISFKDWEWILKNTFEIEDLIYYLSKHRIAKEVASSLKRSSVKLIIKSLVKKEKKAFYIKEASQKMALEIEEFRRKDRLYWQSIIEELKRLNKKGKLLPEGSIPPSEIQL